MKKGKIIIVDDNNALLHSLRIILSHEFEKVITLPAPTTLPALLVSGDTDIVLLDMNFITGKQSGEEGLFWLDRILEREFPPAVILMTAYAGIDLAISALKRGASDFIVKPWNNEKLSETLRTVRNKREIMSRNQKEKAFATGSSLPSLLLNYLLNKYASTYGKPVPVLTKEAHQKWEEAIVQGNLNLLEESIERTILLLDKNKIEIDDIIWDTTTSNHDSGMSRLEDMEKQFISRALKENKGNLSTTALQLDISRQTLYNKIKKYNL